jgi:hypothetical protein
MALSPVVRWVTKPTACLDKHLWMDRVVPIDVDLDQPDVRFRVSAGLFFLVASTGRRKTLLEEKPYKCDRMLPL